MTVYNEILNYNAAIPYNGTVTPPVPPVHLPVGGYAYPPQFPRKKKKPENEEDEIIAMLIAELIEDDD